MERNNIHNERPKVSKEVTVSIKPRMRFRFRPSGLYASSHSTPSKPQSGKATNSAQGDRRINGGCGTTGETVIREPSGLIVKIVICRVCVPGDDADGHG